MWPRLEPDTFLKASRHVNTDANSVGFWKQRFSMIRAGLSPSNNVISETSLKCKYGLKQYPAFMQFCYKFTYNELFCFILTLYMCYCSFFLPNKSFNLNGCCQPCCSTLTFWKYRSLIFFPLEMFKTVLSKWPRHIKML